MRDRDQKGRRVAPKGSDVGTAKLTEMDVREIRQLAASMSQVQLALKYGVKQPAISDILVGKTWTHVDAEPVEVVDAR
jgi:hypothetical protein